MYVLEIPADVLVESYLCAKNIPPKRRTPYTRFCYLLIFLPREGRGGASELHPPQRKHSDVVTLLCPFSVLRHVSIYGMGYLLGTLACKSCE